MVAGWGPPADAASGAPTPEQPAEEQPVARRSAWDTVPEAPTAAAAADTAEKLSTIEWGGVAIGETGWMQHTLADGRHYYLSEGETSWERPVARNHTKVGVDAAAAEPLVMEAVGAFQSPSLAFL